MSYLNNSLKGIADRVNKIDAEKSFNLQLINIDNLIPSSNNFYGIREIEELTESIKESGLMHNLVVRKLDNENYEILSGERRFHALKSLNYKKVPCQVKEMNETDGEILLIQANAKQRELTPTEKMKSIERLEQLYAYKKAKGEEVPKGKTRDIIGKDIGLSGVQVGRYSKVSKNLIEPLKEKLDEGTITLTQADTLSNLKDNEQEAILNQIDNTSSKISNAEIDILVEGIKQTLTSKKDIELLEEINVNKIVDKDCKIVDEIQKVLSQEKYRTPKVIISSKYIQGDFYTKGIIFDGQKFEITLSGFGKVSKIIIISKDIKQVKELIINNKKLSPNKAYEIAPNCFIWFSYMEE